MVEKVENDVSTYNRLDENKNKFPLSCQKPKKFPKNIYLFLTLVSTIVILTLFIAAFWVLVQEKFSKVDEKLQNVHAIEKGDEKFQKLKLILNKLTDKEKHFHTLSSQYFESWIP